MNCTQCKELLVLDFEGLLDPSQEQAVKQHLKDCPSCQAELQALQTVQERLVKDGKALARSDLENKVFERIIREQNVRLKRVTRINASLKIRRIIMKSKITRFAAAAVIVVALLYVLNIGEGDGVAWGEVLNNIEKVKAFTYRMKMSMKAIPGMPKGKDGMEMEIEAWISKELGMRMNCYVEGELISKAYVLMSEGAVVSVIPPAKRYVRMTLTGELFEKAQQDNGDPRKMVDEFMKCGYTELGPSTIDGIQVEGIESRDPKVAGGILGDIVARLWVAVENDLPVKMEIVGYSNGTKALDMVVDEFRWDVEIDVTEFEPNIPDDYILMADVQMSGDERDVVEGLRFFAELTGGKYPSEMSVMTLTQELQDAMRTRLASRPESAPGEEDMQKMVSLQMLFTFYAGLVTEEKDPAYYGHKVTAEFPQAVLMRWKLEDGNYRVIFGDLTVTDVTADELAELEAAPLNIKPTAIKPQPADGATAAALVEVELSWMPGAYVTEHKVHFGTATDQLPLLAEVTDSCSITAPALEKATTYYWRVDEVQPDGSIVTGDVWSFDTGKLVGWWKLDGDANDSSGNGNHGTVSGEPNLAVGVIGGALQFDGIDDYIQTDYATDLPAWTVAVWMNSPAGPSSAVPTGPVHRENNFQINWNHSSADFRGAAALRVGNTWYAASFGELEADTWYHLAATYDGENLKAYKNGVLITDNPDPSGAPDKERATLKFARHANYNDCFEGTIDDVSIYSYDLSADEVASIYASQTEEK